MIGGMVPSTILALVVIPVLLPWFASDRGAKEKPKQQC